jgi:hypothetical protein
MNKEEQKAHKREKFIKELTELSRRHGIIIGGCGCCGSPFVRDIPKGERQNAGYELSDGTLNWKGK